MTAPCQTCHNRDAAMHGECRTCAQYRRRHNGQTRPVRLEIALQKHRAETAYEQAIDARYRNLVGAAPRRIA